MRIVPITRNLSAAALVALGAAGCDVFDEQLERRIVEADDRRDAGSDAAMALFQLADTCRSGGLPHVEGARDPMLLSSEGLRSSVAESGECAIAQSVLDGADGFFEIEANAGERWHFHLDPAPGQDLSVYASRSCDLRECVAAADVCGVGESEHFTFVAERAGTYVVVVEGMDAEEASPLSLLAINPICGDSVKDHGEVCDDGNVTPGDGCDAACRVELRANSADEVEPNDDTYLANVLAPPDANASIKVQGKIAGNACQPDYFLLRVPGDRVLDARLLTGAGAACSGAPSINLQLLGADRDELRETAVRAQTSGSGGQCPTLTDHPIGAGSYFLRLQRGEVAPQFSYQLEITLREPDAEP